MGKHILSKGVMTLAALAAVGAGFGAAALASAQSNPRAGDTSIKTVREFSRPVVAGKVTSINGTTLTIEAMRPQDKTAATYTVDISKAEVTKGFAKGAPVTGTAADITVGSMVGVDGTVSGTTVSATKVMTGMPGKGTFFHRGGRGEHGAMGTVSSVSGSTITVTGKDGTTYTVNAAGATVSKMVGMTVSDIKVGDTIGVQGEKSGTIITAKHIVDGIPDKQDDLDDDDINTQ